MFASFLIGIREGLEASLIVAILVAYVVKIDRRDLLGKVWTGVGLAALLSLAAGALLTFTGSHLSDTAEEVFAGSMSILAVALITWMVFWMARNARFIKSHLHGEIDKAVLRSAWALALVAFLAVAREGLETALFIWAGIQSTGSNGSETTAVVGALLGLAASVVIGVLIYRGAVKLDLAKLFKWTGGALVVVAAGVLSYAVSDLQEAGVLPGADNYAFNVSEQIPEDSWYGTLLKGTISFTPETTWLQLITWALYLIIVMSLFVRTVRKR